MLMPASSEFIDLCQAQVKILCHSLGAASAVVYLTEKLVNHKETELVPIVAFPESAMVWESANWKAFPQKGLPPEALFSVSQDLERLHHLEQVDQSEPDQRALPSDVLTPELVDNGENYDQTSAYTVVDNIYSKESYSKESYSKESLGADGRLVVPLMHEGVVMGLLVATRRDRPWKPPERAQLDQFACTLAFACVLDQRGQWLQQKLRKQRLVQARQSRIFHDLMHQFRNPLTALRTFGKLLLKRLQPEDGNHKIAAGITRESDRLQELLQQFDAALDFGDAELGEVNTLPPGLSPALLPASKGDPASVEAEAEPVDKTASDSAITLSEGELVSPEPPPRLLPSAGLGIELRVSICKVTEILEPLLISAAAVAQERQIILHANAPINLPFVWADSRALREVLSNLIDNALKYSPAGSWVWVQAGLRQQKPGGVYQGILVGDTGPGIPAEDLGLVFQRHYRGVQAQTDIPGTGLGLAIAKDLITEMKGVIEVFSPAANSGLLPVAGDELDGFDVSNLLNQPSQGQGTAFVVWLPEFAG